MEDLQEEIVRLRDERDVAREASQRQGSDHDDSIEAMKRAMSNQLKEEEGGDGGRASGNDDKGAGKREPVGAGLAGDHSVAEAFVHQMDYPHRLWLSEDTQHLVGLKGEEHAHAMLELEPMFCVAAVTNVADGAICVYFNEEAHVAEAVDWIKEMRGESIAMHVQRECDYPSCRRERLGDAFDAIVAAEKEAEAGDKEVEGTEMGETGEAEGVSDEMSSSLSLSRDLEQALAAVQAELGMAHAECEQVRGQRDALREEVGAREGERTELLDEMATLRAEGKMEKYVKMLKLGLPLGAVRQKMSSDGLDPNMLQVGEDGKPRVVNGEKQVLTTVKAAVARVGSEEVATTTVKDEEEEKVSHFSRLRTQWSEFGRHSADGGDCGEDCDGEVGGRLQDGVQAGVREGMYPGVLGILQYTPKTAKAAEGVHAFDGSSGSCGGGAEDVADETSRTDSEIGGSTAQSARAMQVVEQAVEQAIASVQQAAALEMVRSKCNDLAAVRAELGMARAECEQVRDQRDALREEVGAREGERTELLDEMATLREEGNAAVARAEEAEQRAAAAAEAAEAAESAAAAGATEAAAAVEAARVAAVVASPVKEVGEAFGLGEVAAGEDAGEAAALGGEWGDDNNDDGDGAAGGWGNDSSDIGSVNSQTLDDDGEGVEQAALGFNVETLDTLPRKELQALAKQHGVKANGKSARIINLLRDIATERQKQNDDGMAEEKAAGDATKAGAGAPVMAAVACDQCGAAAAEAETRRAEHVKAMSEKDDVVGHLNEVVNEAVVARDTVLGDLAERTAERDAAVEVRE